MAVLRAKFPTMDFDSPQIMEIPSSSRRLSDPFKDPPMITTRALSSASSDADEIYDNDYDSSLESYMESEANGEFVQIQITNTSGRRHFHVDNLAENTEKFVVSSQFTKGKPDLTMHEGNNDSGKVLGAARLHFFSKDMDVAIGDPDDLWGQNGRETLWIKLESKSIFSTIRQWTMPTPHLRKSRPSGERYKAAPEAGKSYVWKRTRNMKGLGEFSDIRLTKVTFKHLKLMEVSSGKVVAVYVNNPKSWSHMGTFYFSRGMSEDWTNAALLSGLIILEEWRRNE